MNRRSRSSNNPIENGEGDPKPFQTKVYIYVQLKGVVNLPKRNGPIEAKLQLGDEEIPRLDRECYSCRLTPNEETDCNVTFSFPVYQDSVETLNMASDNPILIALYERVFHGSDESLSEGYEELIPIAQGFIDLLGYFQKKRFSDIVDTYVFPIDKADQINGGTCKMCWQVYTLLPLLKNLEYANLIFLSFESLYNCTQELFQYHNELKVDIVFRDEEGKQIIEICSFSGFYRQIIKQQNPNFMWETARSVEQITGSSFGFHTDSKISVDKIFKRLLRPKGKRLDFKGIDIENTEALVCNGTHRFVLTEELRALLEDVFVFRTQGLMVRLYRKEAPQEILLEGAMDPSVFLYPFVNAVRFAVTLQSPQKTSPKDNKKRKSKKDSLSIGDGVCNQVFGIISMCLLTPITESLQNVVKCAQTVPKAKLNYCVRKSSDVTMAPIPYLRESAYDSFDEWLAQSVHYIVRNNVQEVNDAKNFFCCQSQNAENKILALVALDFNQRTKTKDNIEFCNLLTTVYKELEERSYKYIHTCGEKDLIGCRYSDNKAHRHLIDLMDYMKLANEIGDKTFRKIIMDELKDSYSRSIDYNFYKFLDDVENSNFKDAKLYIAKPIKDRKLQDEYFVRLLDVYIQYMENLTNENVYNEAFEMLLCSLNEFLKYYRADPAGWILLYCLYNSSEYLPGIEFTRWHFEDLDISSQKLLTDAPYPLWDMYCNIDIQFSTIRSTEFYHIVKMFLSVGAYKFAEIVFNEIEGDCMEIERYMHVTTQKILLKEFNSNLSPKEFPDLPIEVQAMLNQVNGNLSYASGDQDQAMDFYEVLYSLVRDVDEVQVYRLGLRRFSNQLMGSERFGKALKVLKVLNKAKDSMSGVMALGMANYKLGRLREALEYFKQATEWNFFVPDVWGYLALIHLKLGENFHALECWKYAKHNPDVEISKEIINELNNICIDDVDLFVDRLY